MITSFFNKSKPVNFVIVFLITLLAFIVAKTHMGYDAITGGFLFKQALLLLVAYSSILLLNFVVGKNSLSKKNHYELLLFSLFFLTIVETTNEAEVLLANFFVLLALRRLLSVRSQRELKKKYFDAAFWIAVASLFYFWVILFFVLILASLVLYSDNNIRHWVVPFLGVAAVFVISVAASVIFYGGFFNVFDLSLQVDFDFSKYNSTKFLIAITLLLSFGLWSLFFYIRNIKQKKKSNRTTLKTVVLAAVIGFVIVLLTPNKNGSEFLFLFAPLAVVVSNYIESISEKWFREVFLGVLIIVPFVLLML
ncbi:DUF6427 family protein [Tamlana crocina]